MEVVKHILALALFGVVLFFFLNWANPLVGKANPSKFQPDGFEHGRGSITLGCAFSYSLPPDVDSPFTGLLLLEVVGDNEQPPSLRAIVDGPQGLTVLIGEGCKASINWTYFPLKESE